jgi:hypothetical protein
MAVEGSRNSESCSYAGPHSAPVCLLQSLLEPIQPKLDSVPDLADGLRHTRFVAHLQPLPHPTARHGCVLFGFRAFGFRISPPARSPNGAPRLCAGTATTPWLLHRYRAITLRDQAGRAALERRSRLRVALGRNRPRKKCPSAQKSQYSQYSQWSTCPSAIRMRKSNMY